MFQVVSPSFGPRITRIPNMEDSLAFKRPSLFEEIAGYIMNPFQEAKLFWAIRIRYHTQQDYPSDSLSLKALGKVYKRIVAVLSDPGKAEACHKP